MLPPGIFNPCECYPNQLSILFDMSITHLDNHASQETDENGNASIIYIMYSTPGFSFM